MCMCEELFLFLGAHMGYVWLIGALLLLFFEIGTPGLFFFISFAIGALCAALIAFMDFSLYTQCWVAFLVTLGAFVIIKMGISRYTKKFKTNIDALIGLDGSVVQEIKLHAPGKVKVRGEVWLALSHEDSLLDIGTLVKIYGSEGNKLIVRRVHK
jgi:membrane protein implicated in regulation of membrane protease activity